MSNALDITVEQAREIVRVEAIRKGWVRPELSLSNNPETVEVLESLRHTRESLGDTVNVIATELYSRTGRFILELIQNIEDCSFTHTDKPPTISFTVSPIEIVVESNQDGFLERDVAGICRTGRSWKRGNSGYVGDKGIGFKSVFKVASRVEIQSNAFSFSFEYDGGESAEERLGIITPIVGDRPILPGERPLTRMTLTKNERTRYRNILFEFEALPKTLLLFLSKVKEIHFQIDYLDPARTITRNFDITEEEIGTSCISMHTGNSNSPEQWRYLVVKAPILQLPNDPARRGMNSCEAVLAFPVDEHGLPSIRTGQDIYAFLPVCTVGFNFLLQADFLLQANREELIFDSDWNIEILNRTVEVFCNAMDDFSARPDLRFSWIRFLPNPTAFHMNGLWHKFSSQLLENLIQRRILYRHGPNERYSAELRVSSDQLRILPATHLDENGAPLFADLPGRNSRYLSLAYEHRDVEFLKTVFGVREIEGVRMVNRIKYDLNNPASVMKNPRTSLQWHNRAADLIKLLMGQDQGVENMIKQDLPLVPLNDGRWVTASTPDLRFPSRSGPAIPQDLVTTIRPDPPNSASRRSMFEQLGVTDILPTTVIKRIWRFYTHQALPTTLDISKAHLAYLYWHHDLVRANDDRFSQLWLIDNNGVIINCDNVRTIYLPANDDYGVLELLKSVRKVRSANRIVPECAVHYVNTEYLTLFPSNTRRHGLTWLEWLAKGPGVRNYLRLKYRAGSLSSEFRHLLLYRPEKIIKVLKMNWAIYRREITTSIEGEISQAEVTCLNSRRAVLSTTYFPMRELTNKAEELGVIQTFPFVAVRDLAQDNELLEDWGFLARFGVKFEANLQFYLDILRLHCGPNALPWNSETKSGIVKTYEKISDICNEMNQAVVIEAFHHDSLILHPHAFRSDAMDAVWLEADRCLWIGPEGLLLEKIPLGIAVSYRNNNKLRRLFCEFLGIRNANWTDYRDTLIQLKTRRTTPPDLEIKVVELYRKLARCRISDEDWGSLLTTFETEGLVYAPQSPFWFAPSQCLWASPVPVNGKAILHPWYADDPGPIPFFQTRLKISAASLATLVEGLRALAQGVPSISRIKEMIGAINAMSPQPEDLASLADVNFLPIAYSSFTPTVINFHNCRSNFSIVDRKKLTDIFKRRTAILDFSLEEVRHLDPFLQGLSLGNKFLSRLCIEETACRDDGTEDIALTEKFRDRACYLLRCAVSNRTPLVIQGHYQPLYDRLLATLVLKSDGISTKYTIRYPNSELVGPILQNTGHVHIQEQETTWQIFVPRDRDAMEVCYMRELPNALAKLFQTPQARESIGHVLNSRVSVIDELLDNAGVAKIPGLVPAPRRGFEDLEDARQDFDVEVSSTGASGSNDHPRFNNSQRSFGQNEEGGDALSDVEEFHTPRSASAHSNARVSPALVGQLNSPLRRASPAVPEVDEFDTPNAYLQLLDNVIRIARRSTLPDRTASSGPHNGSALPGYVHNDAFGLRTQGQMKHDVKVGAAGELFVYELLLGLLSPEFGWDNWTSTINGQVLIHPEYAGRRPWPGRREVSDLTFRDIRGILTGHLIRGGYLTANVWSEATPEYLIEVKTTTGDCGDRFFMSRNQYEMMQDMALVEGQVSQKIYVLFRVYDLGKDSMNVKIYVDPEAHRRSRSLEFTQHTWTVRPN